MKQCRLDEMNYNQIKGKPPFEVAVLPLGATEPHNLHLPYGTDTFQVEVIAQRACAIGDRGRCPGVATPRLAVWYGDQPDEVSAGHEFEPDDALAGDHRSGGFAGDAWDFTVRALERARGQRSEVDAARLHCQRRCVFFSATGTRWHLTSIRPYSSTRTTTPASWRPAWGWPFSAPGLARPGGCGVSEAEPLRGGQSRLGRDHPPLAPPDHQLGQATRGPPPPPRGNGHPTGHRANRPVLDRAGREPRRRFIPVLTGYDPAAAYQDNFDKHLDNTV